MLHPSQGFRKKKGTEKAKMPPVKCLSWLWLRVSPGTKILQTLRQTLQARAGFVSADCVLWPFGLSQRELTGAAAGFPFVLLMAFFV